MNNLKNAAGFLQENGFTGAKTAVVLGSGLGGFADEVINPVAVEMRKIPGYPAPSVEGHGGRILIGEIEGARVLVYQGRAHLYEGHSPGIVCAPVIVSRLLGVESIILTTASGAINPDFTPGDLMLMEDFITLGFNITFEDIFPGKIRRAAQTVFPDKELFNAAIFAAENAGVNLRRGIFGYASGPSYETPSEVKALRFAGADAVSMSTVPEIIAATGLGMKTAAFSCITNMAAGISAAPLTHDEVQEVGKKLAEPFKIIVKGMLADRKPAER